MKKLIAIILAVAGIISLSACNPPSDEPDVSTPTGETPTPEQEPDSSPDGSLSEALQVVEETPVPAPVFTDMTASDWVNGIKIGWNLGNTFDAHAGHGEKGFSWLGDGTYASLTPKQLEAAWVNHATTRDLIDALYDAGFNAIRIPVTWFKAVDSEYNIREDWLDRVDEVVGWAMENDMYVILNTHHDEELFKFSDAETDAGIEAFVKIWEQLAVRFRDYGDKLAFEGLNEPRTPGSSKEWSGGTSEEHNNINRYGQAFVDTIRASGGLNAGRVLILTTYAASAEEAAQKGFVMPDDPADERIVVSLHMYSPWEFALRTGETGVRHDWDKENPRDTDPITHPLDLAHNLFVSGGIPVIIGEMGALNRDNTEARVAWSEFYVSYAKSLEMPCFWWDNAATAVTSPAQWGGWHETFGLFDRATAEVVHPEIIEALMRASS